jgi:uncharacterized protein YgiM (DUF1202 family)
MAKTKNVIIGLGFFALLCSSLTLAREWGEIKYVHSKTNIRSGRSQSSAIVGQLEAGQKVKVDFLENGWYAIFAVDKASRFESDALGYV